MTKESWFDSQQKKEFFSLVQVVPLSGYQGIFLGSEADHSSPYCAEVKNEWNSMFTSQYSYIPVPLVFYVYLKRYNL